MTVRKLIAFFFVPGLLCGPHLLYASPRPRAQFIYDLHEVLSFALRELNTFNEDQGLRHVTGDNPPRTSRSMAIVSLAVFEALDGLA